MNDKGTSAAQVCPRFDLRLHVMLRREGRVVNKKPVHLFIRMKGLGLVEPKTKTGESPVRDAALVETAE